MGYPIFNKEPWKLDEEPYTNCFNLPSSFNSLFESKPNTLDFCYDIVSLAKKLSVALKLEFQWMMKIWGNMLLNVFVTATGPVTKERGNQRLQL